MTALVLTDYKQMSYCSVPDPEISSNEVLVRVKSCGICGSDIHGYDGSTGRRRPPVIMGHEASGIIEKIGTDVKTWVPGDRVTFDSTIYCNECDSCRKGYVNLCTNRKVIGVSCEDYRRDGAFAELIAIPQHILYRIPDNVTFDQAAMIEPLSVAFHAANLAPHQLGASVAVVGTGKIGMLSSTYVSAYNNAIKENNGLFSRLFWPKVCKKRFSARDEAAEAYNNLARRYNLTMADETL